MLSCEVHVQKYTKEEWSALPGTGGGKDAQWNALGRTLETSKPEDQQEERLGWEKKGFRDRGKLVRRQRGLGPTGSSWEPYSCVSAGHGWQNASS